MNEMNEMNEPIAFYWQQRCLLRLKRQHATLFQIDTLLEDLTAPEIAHLAAELPAFLKAQRAEVRIFGHEPPHHQQLLSALPLTSYEKFFYDKDLRHWHAPDLTGYNGLSLAETGEADFLAAMVKASEGDLLSADQDPEAELAELKAQADSLYDPQHWFVACFQGQPIGIVLPQCFADKPTEGTLFYFGLFAEARGQGHGVALHSWGLQQLQARGCLRYVGSTGSENPAMQRIFDKQACQLKHHLTFYRSP